MKKCEIKITHGQQTKTYFIRKGLRLDALNAKQQTPIEYDCRKADCGICIFSVEKGMDNLSPQKDEEKEYLQSLGADSNERLGCQCRVQGDIHITVEHYE